MRGIVVCSDQRFLSRTAPRRAVPDSQHPHDFFASPSTAPDTLKEVTVAIGGPVSTLAVGGTFDGA